MSTDRDMLVTVQGQLTMIQGEIAAQLGTAPPVPVPPIPIPPTPIPPIPTPPSGNDSGFWQQGRWRVDPFAKGQVANNTFKVPDNWPGTKPNPAPPGWGTVSFGFSYPAGDVICQLDGHPAPGEPGYPAFGWVEPNLATFTPGSFHTLTMQATKDTGGSVNINHTP